MWKRSLAAFLVCAAVLCLFSGCKKTEEAITPSLPTLGKASSVVSTDAYKILNGTWEVGGLYYGEYLIDISDNDTLKELYDNRYLSFFEDGTFLYMNVFSSSGKCIEKSMESFILRTDSVFTYDITGEGLVKREVDSSDADSFLATILDDNTIQLDILDAATGNAAVDSYKLLFVKEDQDSAFIRKNKTLIGDSTDTATGNGKSQTKEKESVAPGDSSQENQFTETTRGMQNALKSAKDYLSIMSFSYSGLIEQLEYEGYSNSEAKYAADNCGADWYEQAVKSAKQYLSIMAFSRSGLIDQLEYDGYTYDQAVYGVDRAY